MKTLIHTILAACGLLCGACVPSIHPLYTERDLMFDPAILGHWVDTESSETWEFSQAGEKEYRLIHIDEHGKRGEFKARLLMIDGRTFLDLSPTGPAFSQNDFYAGHIMVVHSFVQIQQNGAGYKISFLDPKWLKPHLEKNPGSLGHTVVDGEILITDSSKNLQRFLSQNFSTPGAFSDPVSVKRKGSSR